MASNGGIRWSRPCHGPNFGLRGAMPRNSKSQEDLQTQARVADSDGQPNWTGCTSGSKPVLLG
ncbi:hypothetical protein PISMIDRAFT_675173 [Pisolithus microcarpus 441]|uniref:Uncharacterized protein n=1 Tax=Pisolithus microcarpus 441 TaxID=765257 RepID=A0A0C9YQD7_9AGAM|nr:hypothetical protein PISMIDRAFT_675173 [Pisolithus microcarpus 441]